jgi:hypothetical protein
VPRLLEVERDATERREGRGLRGASQREKIASLYERIVGLERTVASVRAIAAFAKVHKA